MSELEHNLLADMLDWYRLQRHDFQNHWQVVMGNLQLQQPEKALNYMRELTRPQEEQKISLLPIPVLAAILLGLVIRLKERSIAASLDYPAAMRQADFWQNHWREEYGEGLLGYTRKCLAGIDKTQADLSAVTADIYLFEEDGGFSLQVIFEDEDRVIFDGTERFVPESFE